MRFPEDLRSSRPSDRIRAQSIDAGTVSLTEIGIFLRRYRWTILLPIVIALVCALMYVMLATAKYTSASRVLVDPQAAPGLQEENAASREVTIDSAAIESRAEAIQSHPVLVSVINRLNLTEDSEFQNKGILFGLLPNWGKSLTLPERVETAVDILRSKLTVRRIGQSRVIEVTTTSIDPERSAALANGVVDAYLDQLVQRNAATARAAAEWLEQRITELHTQLNAAAAATQAFRTQSSGADAQARLQQLETTAEAYRQSYQMTLRRYVTAVQQQSFPLVDTRVLALATRPLTKSWPKPGLSIALAGVLGTVLGLGLAIMRNTVSCGIRTRQQIEDLGPSCVGAIPAVRGRPQALVWEVCKAPYSLFADRLRDLKVELDLVRNEAPLCVGIAPILEGVGSSTVAANVAHLFSLAGTRCVLVDGDLRRYELTARLMQDHVGDGLAAVLRSEATREVEVVLDHSNLAFIPAGTNSAIANSSDLLGSAGMRELLGGLRKRFVITLIDLPAVVEVSDAKAISPYLDGILLVIEYDRTCADTAGQQLRALENAGARVLGLVLNKADARSDKLR